MHGLQAKTLQRRLHPPVDLCGGKPQVFQAEDDFFFDGRGQHLSRRVLKDQPGGLAELPKQSLVAALAVYPYRAT